MVKKSLIAIALMGMLASTSFAGDLASKDGYWKFDDFWPIKPLEYEVLELCQIPIFIDVGMYIELENCGKKDRWGNLYNAIILEQVSCSELVDSGAGDTFPCYRGCDQIRVRSNFEALLGLKLYKKDLGGHTYFINSSWGNDYWLAYFDDPDTAGTVETLDEWTVPGDGNWSRANICVEAWDVNVFLGDPESKAESEVNRVGEVAVTVVPTAAPDACVLCP